MNKVCCYCCCSFRPYRLLPQSDGIERDRRRGEMGMGGWGGGEVCTHAYKINGEAQCEWLSICLVLEYVYILPFVRSGRCGSLITPIYRRRKWKSNNANATHIWNSLISYLFSATVSVCVCVCVCVCFIYVNCLGKIMHVYRILYLV